jgi:hypothetical protein
MSTSKMSGRHGAGTLSSSTKGSSKTVPRPVAGRLPGRPHAREPGVAGLPVLSVDLRRAVRVAGGEVVCLRDEADRVAELVDVDVVGVLVAVREGLRVLAARERVRGEDEHQEGEGDGGWGSDEKGHAVISADECVRGAFSALT